MGEGHSFAPGESPYHVKGGLYLGTQKYFAANVEGGMDALARAIDDPKLRDFIQQHFLASSWYDVLPVAELIHAEARAAKQSTEAYLRIRAQFQAKEDMGGVYKFLLWLATPEAVAQRLPRMLNQFFDFGTLDIAKVESRFIRATFSGYPKILWKWYVNAFNIYTEAAIKTAGARVVGIVPSAATSQMMKNGVELVSFSFDLRWT